MAAHLVLLFSLHFIQLTVAQDNTSTITLGPGLIPAYIQTLCFGFPAPTGDTLWIEPVATALNLTCPPGSEIRLQRAQYLRPDVRGDLCTSDEGCDGETCCCEPWKVPTCRMDIEKAYPKVYPGANFSAYPSVYPNLSPNALSSASGVWGRLQQECENRTQCEVNVTSQAMDGQCTVSGCNSQHPERRMRCWARWLQVHYMCTVAEMYVSESVTEVEKQADVHTESQIQLGLVVAIPLAVMFSFLLVLLVCILCIRKRRHKSHTKAIRSNRADDTVTSTSLLQLQTHPSYNHTPNNHSTDNHTLNNHDTDNHSLLPGVNNNLKFIESQAYVPPSVNMRTDKTHRSPTGSDRPSNHDKGDKDNVSEVELVENTYYESINDDPEAGVATLRVRPDSWTVGEDTGEGQEHIYEPLALCVSAPRADTGGEAV